MRIAIAGGTGLVGQHVTSIVRERGHHAVVLSRSTGVDITSGQGLAQKLEGADAVIDVLSISTLKAAESEEFFITTTRALLKAEQDAGVPHHVALSIVGINKAPFDYYAGKVAQEHTITAGDVPWTIQRATQFHEFAPQMFGQAKVGPLHLAPKMRTQPIAAREVAETLVTLAEGAPVGRPADLAGPREENLVEMIRAYARATGHRGWIPSIGLPGPFGKAQRDGSLLPEAGAKLGSQTFAEWVSSAVAR